ncbi:MAG: D-glycero-beta-D-manno-heptose 1-phosphate adenylyltransferase [Halanaerobium sp.]|nr:D-glycero-beta-D-manno-heptose 1-phosphate adenylyltransferase [Halanaerobium sp.]
MNSGVMSNGKEWRSRLASLREKGTIVFTNGCFDLLHTGHIKYLRQAKALGDYLIVGLNDDASVKSLKGPERPIVPLEGRAEVLQALEMVDLVIPFSGQTAERLVAEVRPDIYVKGGDYKLEEIPEAVVAERNGSKVKILSLEQGWSTSRIIADVLARYQKGE